MLFRKGYWDNASQELNISHGRESYDRWEKSFFGTEVDLKDYGDEAIKNNNRFQEIVTCDNTENVIFKYLGDYRGKFCQRCLFEYSKIRSAIQWMNNIQTKKEYEYK